MAVVRGSIEPALWRFDWSWLRGPSALEDAVLVQKCVELYSRDYGIWGPNSDRAGEPIRTSPERLSELLRSDDAYLACAFQGDVLAGYCTGLRFEIPDRGRVAWMTQLVVDRLYRKQRVATTLLYGVWQFSDCYAWGLASANPYAVRALETATRRPCRARLITRLGPELLNELSPRVPYLPPSLVETNGAARPRVDTEFFVDMRDMQELREGAARQDRRWALGDLEPGQEWFACTFGEQVPDALTDSAVADLLVGADAIWIEAYERMTLSGEHLWHRHGTAEVDYVLERARVAPGGRVLDVGCGDGRHAQELAEGGLETVAIDISRRLVGAAVERTSAMDRPPSHHSVDARKELPPGPFELVLLLYDVIGSSAQESDDEQMLRNVFEVLRPGAFAIAGVLNAELTREALIAEHRPQTVSAFVSALEQLPASSAMEQSGDIFDPDHLLLFDGVYYRKEQFEEADWRLPAELVVRDRRFGVSEIASLFEDIGFKVLEVRPVQSGHWEVEPALEPTDPRAKELLVIARRPSAT